jgi:hypothetical protein
LRSRRHVYHYKNKKMVFKASTIERLVFGRNEPGLQHRHET